MTEAERNALILEFKRNFPDPGWPEDVRPAITGDCLDALYIIEHFQGRKWQEMSSEELAWMSQDAWAFTPNAFLYFLPAWCVDDLLTDIDTHSCHLNLALNDNREELDETYDQPQKACLLTYLLDAYPTRSCMSPDLLITMLLEQFRRVDTRPIEND